MFPDLASQIQYVFIMTYTLRSNVSDPGHEVMGAIDGIHSRELLQGTSNVLDQGSTVLDKIAPGACNTEGFGRSSFTNPLA
jgi:hypothetical protein